MDRESIENKLIKTYEKQKKFDNLPKEEKEPTVKLTEKEIQMIAEIAASKVREINNNEGPKSEVLDNYFDLLEPKKQVIHQREFSQGVRIAGWIILSLCGWYWIYFFFILQEYEPLTYTTYITLILISLTCINKFESIMLNSITCLTVYGFISISFWLLVVTNNIAHFIGGFVLHLAMGFFQGYLVLHKRIPMSKRYLICGFLFYTIFLSSYDQFQRLNIMTGQQEIFTDLATAVHFFYSLGISLILIYWYKKRYGILLP
ncbi:MAG: hypothetical protein EU544_04700 [Promethearchaeota archaeon]|nr:MAG: hypothetical protein EU544_04700 [Candidatus Lokiarchaeota archaeon]